MESLNRYVDAWIELESAEKDFRKDLSETLGISEINIQRVDVYNRTDSTQITQVVRITLRGVNRMSSKAISKIDGMTIITPKHIEIDAGEIHL